MPFQNTLIVALTTNDAFPNLSYTPHSFNVGTKTVLVHSDPQVTSDQCNFDLWVDVDISYRETPKLAPYFAGDRYHKFTRHGKDTQSLLLESVLASCELVNNFQPIPTYANTAGSTVINSSAFLSEVCKTESSLLVIKDCWGARGTGQLLIEPHFLSALSGFLHSSKKELQARLPSAVMTPTHTGNDDSPFFNSHRVVVQPLVRVDREWRCIVAGNTLVAAFERTRHELTAGYPQAGKDASGPVLAKEVNVVSVLPTSLVKDVEFIATKLNVGIGSIDLFEYEDGGYGIFEWCQEFGVVGYDPRDVTSWCTDFIKHCLREADLIEKG